MLLSGELDYVTIIPFIAGAATRGLPVKVIAATTESAGYAIISRPDIASVKDLKGKGWRSTRSAGVACIAP